MNIVNMRVLVGIIFIFVCLPANSAANKELPQILNYYPLCDYKVIKTITVKKRIPRKNINNGSANSDEYLSLIRKLQDKALYNNAQAIIILSSHFSIAKFRSKKKTPLLSYNAELIHACNDLSPNKDKITAVDNTGKKTIGSWSVKKETTSIKFTLLQNPKLNRPEITNNHVSLSQGVYGVKLGFNRQQVEELLGTPDIQLAILKDEDVVGYGRRLWLYFQKDKLVKIDTLTPPVTEEILNRIPLRDFFDSYPWEISSDISYKKSLEQVRKSLNLQQALINHNQLKIESIDNEFFLDFTIRKDPWTHKKTYTLGGFFMQIKGYKQSSYLTPSRVQQQFNAIDHHYKSLVQGIEINIDVFKQQLGLPIGRIVLKTNRDIVIYNNYLLVESTNQRIVAINLLSSSILNHNRKPIFSESWKISGLTNGLSMAATKILVSKDAYENYEQLEIESDLYQMIIIFDPTKKGLKLAEIEIKPY